VVEIELAFYREAAEHASYALAHFPPGGAEAQRTALLDLVAKAKRDVGTITLRLSVDPAIVSLTVDGKAVTESPVPPELFVDPGEHVLVATAPGYAPTQDKVRTDKGSAHLVTLTLKKQSGGPGPGPGPVKPQPKKVRPITVAGFITAGAAAGLGGAMAVLAALKAGEADTKYQALVMKHDPNLCAGSNPSADCIALHDARKSRDTFADVALWSFVGAGAVTAGTLIYTFAVPQAPAPSKPATTMRVLPAAGPGGGGLLVQGSF
jgi:hypothetical protein